MARSWKFLLVIGSLFVDLSYLSASNGSSIRRSLEFWQKTDFLCNAASICREDFPSDRTAVEFLGDGKTSCCKDCSCSINCGLQSSCCFEGDGNKITSRSEQECLFPTTLQPNGKDKFKYVSYYMYTKHPEKDSLKNGDIRTCGNMDASSSGSLAPVYSKTTGRIYKNSNCANKFGIHDGILWDTQIYCSNKYDLKNRTVYSRTLDDIVFHLERYGKAPGCEYNFLYKGDINDLNSEQCYQNLIETCKEDDFEVPSGVNATSDMVKEACESGLFAPYILPEQEINFEPEEMFGYYRNVFCAICNGYNPYDKDGRYCEDPFKQYGKSPSIKSSFTLLLNSDFMNKENSFKKYPKACKNSNGIMDEDNCRSVFCPTAQYRKTDGSCTFAVSQWIASQIMINLNMMFRQSLKLKDLIGIQYADIIHPLKWPWEITSISFSYACGDSWEEGTDIVSLLLMIVNVSPRSKASKIVSDIEQFMSKDWFVNVNGSKIQVSVSFSLYKFTCNPSDIYCVHQLQKRNITQLCSGTTLPYKSMIMPVNIQELNKLFFCNQVTLQKQEYELISSVILIDRLSDKMFPLEQFSIVNDNNEEEYVRICVEESVFKQIDHLESMAFTNIPDLYFCVVLSVIVNVSYIFFD